MRAFAVIPARLNSSRVPNKNFRASKKGNLVEIAINCAKSAGIFEAIVLSSDHSEVEVIANSEGILPHRRSVGAASDIATANDVLNDVEQLLTSLGLGDEDYLFYLQPTSPLRTPEMLASAWRRLVQDREAGLVSVGEIDPKFSKSMKLLKGRLVPLISDEVATSNQQEIERLFLANGNFFAFKWRIFAQNRQFPLEGLGAVVQSGEQGLDIDTEEDFRYFLSLSD